MPVHVPRGSGRGTTGEDRATASNLANQAVPAPFRQPVVIPDHALLKAVGRDVYGEVWLARNALGTLRAVKVVHLRDLSDVRPFEREYRGIQ